MFRSVEITSLPQRQSTCKVIAAVNGAPILRSWQWPVFPIWRAVWCFVGTFFVLIVLETSESRVLHKDSTVLASSLSSCSRHLIHRSPSSLLHASLSSSAHRNRILFANNRADILSGEWAKYRWENIHYVWGTWGGAYKKCGIGWLHAYILRHTSKGPIEKEDGSDVLEEKQSMAMTMMMMRRRMLFCIF